jgi:hypothetical protein
MASTNTRAKKNDDVETAVAEKKADKPIVPKEVDVNQLITVRNGFQGKLSYRSKRTGEKFVWSEFGDEQEMELRELKAAKNTYKKFFTENWFMFNERWVPEYLGVSKFYKNSLPIDNFDEIFDLTPEKLKQRIKLLSNGQKKSLAYRARVLIAEGEIDSLKKISVLEEALGTELIEKD